MIRKLLKAELRIAIVAAAVLGIPAMARAHAGSDDPNLIHACVGNVSKVVRIVGVSGVCIAAPPLIAETPAHWDIKGKDGTNGINGKDGTTVTFVDYFSGNAHGCPNGGAIYAAGSPAVNTYVCNGRNGIDGKDGKDGLNATRAAAPCFNNTTRYVDCANGTVTDTVTGLIWLKQWNCLPNNTWAAGNQAAAGLKNGDCGLTDNSSAGDWRLPTKDEWSATIARAVALGCRFGQPGGPPSLTNNAGAACYGNGAGSSFAGVALDLLALYWSSTPDVNPSGAWIAYLGEGTVDDVIGKVDLNFSVRVWPVRGGSR